MIATGCLVQWYEIDMFEEYVDSLKISIGNQKDKVLNMLKNNGFFIQKVIKDLGQNNRCITSIKI